MTVCEILKETDSKEENWEKYREIGAIFHCKLDRGRRLEKKNLISVAGSKTYVFMFFS